MGDILHRLGQLVGGTIIAAIGYGFQYARAWIEYLIPLSDQAPIQVPQILTYASWTLYGIGGLLAAIGTGGLTLIAIKRIRGNGGNEEPSDQRPRQQTGKTQQQPQDGYQQSRQPRQQDRGTNQTRPQRQPQDDEPQGRR